MSSQAADLARCLARDAEAVCRHYLPNGRRRGRYWVVGDVANTAGRSLFVRLTGPDSGKGAARKWTDAATGQHGDLLDLIALNRRLERLRDVLDEARSFLSLPRPEPPPHCHRRQPPAPMGSPESARRLFAMAQPISGTIAEAYLRNRGITALHDAPALRFHPRCYYRPDADAPTEIWPALIAAVTDLSGDITGAHRTWLDPTGEDKAPVDTPRRAMGHLLGHGVRFGVEWTRPGRDDECEARSTARRSHRFAGDRSLAGKRAAPAAFKRAIGRQAARARNGGRRLFSAAGIDTPRGRPRGTPGLPALHRGAK